MCLFCLKHAAELECYGQGGLSKPRCTRAGCDGELTPSVHELMGEESASVNLIVEDDDEYESEEDEEWWVGTVRMEEVQEEEGEMLERTDESVLRREAHFNSDIFTRKDDSGLEDELECLWDAHVPSCSGAPEEDRWWSLEPPQASSEEDEEEVQYLMHVLGLEPRGSYANQGVDPAPEGAEARPEEDATAPKVSRRRRPPHPKSAKRKKPRKKAARSVDQEWEQARQDAWLREMLTDTSGSENEEKCGRFEESGRWIAELFGASQQAVTTSRGECSGQKTPDSS